VSARDHDENLIEPRPVESVVKSFYSQVHGVLRTHRWNQGSPHVQAGGDECTQGVMKIQ
jgi:hypothetical protein